MEVARCPGPHLSSAGMDSFQGFVWDGSGVPDYGANVCTLPTSLLSLPHGWLKVPSRTPSFSPHVLFDVVHMRKSTYLPTYLMQV